MMGSFKMMLRNPVFLREVRVRMRGWKAPALVTLYVGVLAALATLIYVAAIRSSGRGAFAPEVGEIIYTVLALAQLGLLIFSVPGLTAGAIAGERERQTLDLLLVTHMNPLAVVLGKLGSAVGFSLLLMIASLPVYGLLFLFGGFPLSRLALTAVIYLVTVLLLGSVGLYFSAVFKRTQAAVVAAYGTSFGVILFSPILALFVFEVFDRGTKPLAIWLGLAYINPVFALAAAMGGEFGQMNNLFRSLLTTPEAQRAIWWKFCLTAAILIGLFIWRTVRKIAPLKQR